MPQKYRGFCEKSLDPSLHRINPLINIWIKNQLKNFQSELKDSDEARRYNLGRKTVK